MWQDKEVQKSHAHLIQQTQMTASLEHELASAGTEHQRLSSELSSNQSQVQKLQQSLGLSQQQCQHLEKARAAMESEADRINAQLVSVQSQLSETKHQLAEAKQSMATLKAQLQLTDQDKAESEKQLIAARTGIANLRVRLDEIGTELRKSKVQSSLQVSQCPSGQTVSCIWLPHAQVTLPAGCAEQKWSYGLRCMCLI